MAIQQMFLGIPSASAAGGSSGSSVSFDGSGDYLEVAKSTDFDFGTGAFTMEAWVYANSLTTGNDIYSQLDSIFESIDWGSQLGQYSFGISNENKVYFYIFDSNNTFYYGTTVLSTQQWYHLAVSRDGSGNIRLFVDGALEESQSNSYSLSNSNQPNPARIGGCKIGNNNAGQIQKSFDGYITNLRVLKGKALYLSNFVEPNQQLENITNTVLLCCNGSSAIDATVAPAGITVQGDTTHDTDNPFGTSSDGSVSIDGNDSLIVALDTLGTNDFTFECWFKAQTSGSPGSHDTLFALSNYGEGGNDSGPGNSFSFYAHNNGGLKIFTRSGGSFNNRYEEAGLYSLNTWTHFAWVRNGTSNLVYINGSETGNWTGQTDYSSGQDLYIGCNDYSRTGVPDEYGVTGNISNARVTIGQALYTSNFTPSTTALTTTSQGATASNVKVLCCNSRTDATAATLPLGITAKGDATSSTEVPSSWDGGYGSVFFDGNGDSISHAATGDYTLDGDWCIECWVNSTDVSLSGGLYKRVWSLASTSNNNDTLFNGLCGSWEDDGSVGGDGRFKLRIDDTVTLQSPSIASDGNWHHFVVQRGGSTISLHVDGVLEASTSYSSNINYSVNTFKIGEHHVFMNGVAGYYSSFPGKISNFRFVNGSSVYPLGASFTVPTSPLKAITNTVLLSCNDPSNAESGTAGPVISKGGNAVHDTSHPF